jgi:hypothetical protein
MFAFAPSLLHDSGLGIRITPAGPSRRTHLLRRRARTPRASAWRPRLDLLEDRRLLSTFTVNSTGDAGTGSGLVGDLRYCITQANSAGGDETITFDSGVFATPQTIPLSGTQLELSDTTGTETITGPAAGVTVNGNNASRVFQIDGGVTASISGLTITGGNAGNGYGGGLLNYGTITLTDCTVSANAGYRGGGIWNGGGTATLDACTLSGNSASYGGGGIWNGGGTATLTACTVTGNSATGSGGGIWNEGGTATLDACTLSGNSADFGGGGIWNGGTAALTACTLSGNSAGYLGGGGIWNWGTAALTACTLSGNSAGYLGGGISNGGTMTIDSSTITGNSADSYGGGIDNIDISQMTITDSTISGNTADWGGGIFNGSPGWVFNWATVTIDSSTISGNSADWGGGGIFNIGVFGTVALTNTIVAGNLVSGTGQDIQAAVQSSSSHNLVGVDTGLGGISNGVDGNLIGTAAAPIDPRLAPLADNGGPTMTLALLLDSPAIDAGSNDLIPAGVQFDQRGPGFQRIANGTVDIGAFEVQTTDHLAVTAQPPTSVTAGAGFDLTVAAQDKSGNVLSSFNGSVTVALYANPGGATLGGTLSVTTKNGVASFSGLKLDKVGTGYTLLVTANGLAATTTNAFTVTPAAASQLLVTTQPPDVVMASSEFGLSVVAEDKFGNMATSFGGSVTVALAANPGGATLGGTLRVTAQSGVASFSGLKLNNPGIGYTLKVSSNGLAAASTGAITVQTTIAAAGVGWGTRTASLQTAADGIRLLPAGRNTDLPWVGISKVSITLGQATTLAIGDLAVRSEIGVNYGPVTVSGSGTSYTITLGQPINKADRVTITIGNAMIASFTRRLDVLPGDFNDDGVVNSQDLVGVRNQWLGFNGAKPTIFGDLNGDGSVNVQDYNAVRAAIGTSLLNLLINGDFSLGNTGFTSQLDYLPIGGTHYGPGYYGIVHNPSTEIWSAFGNFGDHTTGTGLMFASDASTTPGTVAWQETVSVSPATDYVFSGWAASMGQYPIGTPIDPSPARLGFFINGVQIGSAFSVAAQNGKWAQFSAAWNSGTSSIATIKIVDLNTDFVGNDFTMDDLMFSTPGSSSAQSMAAAWAPGGVITGSTFGLPVTAQGSAGEGATWAATTVVNHGTSTASGLGASVAQGVGIGAGAMVVRVGTSHQPSQSNGHGTRAAADRSLPRAEIQLAGRGRSWSLGTPAKVKVVSQAWPGDP